MRNTPLVELFKAKKRVLLQLVHFSLRFAFFEPTFKISRNETFLPFLSNLLKGCQSGTSSEHRVSRELSSSFEIFSKNVKEEHPCNIIFCTTNLSLFSLKSVSKNLGIFLKYPHYQTFSFLSFELLSVPNNYLF